MSEAAPSKLRPELALAVALMVVAALYFGREIFLPIAVAGFLSVLLWPLVLLVERLGLGRGFATVTVMVLFVMALGGIGWLVTNQAERVVENLPRHRDQLIEKVRRWREAVPGKYSEASEAVKAIKREIVAPTSQPATSADSEPASSAPGVTSAGPNDPDAAVATTGPASAPVRVEVVPATPDLTTALANLIGPLLGPLLKLLLTTVFTLFFLLHQGDLRDRVLRLCGQARINVTTSALADAGSRITRYVMAQSVANGLFGFAVGVGLLVLGMNDALLWALTAAGLRFVPYVGTAIAGAVPTLISVATSSNGFQPLMIAGWFLLVDLLIANFFEPNFFGARVGASPTAILLGFVFWGWLWGGIGVFLATPITVCLVVLGKYVPAFEMFYILLGNEPVLEPSTRFYQRLLARDGPDALAIAKTYASDSSPAKTYDELVLPALAQLEEDRLAGMLEPERSAHARQVVDTLLSDLDPQSPSVEGVPPPAAPQEKEILCMLDQGEYDATVCRMAQQLLNGVGPVLEMISGKALTSEVIDLVQRRKPRAVFIATVAPRSLARIELLVRRVAEVAPQVRILVGLVPRPGKNYRRLERIDRLASLRVCRSIVDMVNELKSAALVT